MWTTIITRSTRSTRSTRALAVTSASVAGVAVLVAGGYAVAAEPVRTSAPSTTSATVVGSVSAASPVRVEHEVGKVLEGYADGDTPVTVFLYENSLHGSSLQVVLGDPEDDNLASVDQEGAFIRDGRLDVTVDVNGTPVTLRGTVTDSGKPAKLVDPVQDNGEQLVMKGTNTPLATDVTVTVGSDSAPMDFAPAFAFDLQTRTVTLYGR